MDLLDHPRYKDRPMLLFFEKYVLDVLGELEEKQKKILDEINLKAVFNARAEQWQEVVIEVLRLSNTIKIAILDEWYKYIDHHEVRGNTADVETFVKRFADAYFADDSTIDIWPNEEHLEAARKRIAIKQHEVEKDPLF